MIFSIILPDFLLDPISPVLFMPTKSQKKTTPFAKLLFQRFPPDPMAVVHKPTVSQSVAIHIFARCEPWGDVHFVAFAF